MATKILDFPQPLSELYRPQTIDAFVGLARVKQICQSIIDYPRPNAAYLFCGESGIGKTTMALAVAKALKAELYHLGSREASKDAIEDIWRAVHYSTWNGSNQHVVLCDEADFWRIDLQQMFLSILDSMGTLPHTIFGDWTPSPPKVIWIFTTNVQGKKLLSDSRFEPRFLSRLRIVPFSSYGMAREIAEYLKGIWKAETNGNGNSMPDFLKLSKEQRNNLRACLNELEMEITRRN